MSYYSRDQFLHTLAKFAADSKLEENTLTAGEQPSPQPKKEGPSSQQASPPSILMADVNSQTPGTQGVMKPEIDQPDEEKLTSPFKFRGPDESMSSAAEAAAKAGARDQLSSALDEFNTAHSQTQRELRAVFDNYGPQSAASSEQAKISSVRQHGMLDELQKIARARK